MNLDKDALILLVLPFWVSSFTLKSIEASVVNCPLFPFCQPRQGVIDSSRHAKDLVLIRSGSIREIQTVLDADIIEEFTNDPSVQTCQFDSYFCEPQAPEEIAVLRNVSKPEQCLETCRNTRGCKFFSFRDIREEALCSLLFGCSKKIIRCPDKDKCVSGPAVCSCHKLRRHPEDSKHTDFARWSCQDGRGQTVDPYATDISMWSVCHAR